MTPRPSALTARGRRLNQIDARSKGTAITHKYLLQAIIDQYDQFCDCLKFSSSKHLSWVHCTWTMPQYATMAFSFAVAFSFPVARNGSIRFELTRNENIGPSLRQALQFIEEIVGKCNATEITGPHIWFHAIGIDWHDL
jgi:hypothetical protein